MKWNCPVRQLIERSGAPPWVQAGDRMMFSSQQKWDVTYFGLHPNFQIVTSQFFSTAPKNEVVISISLEFLHDNLKRFYGQTGLSMQKTSKSRQTTRNMNYIPMCPWYYLVGFQHVPWTMLTNTQLWSWIILQTCFVNTIFEVSLMIWTHLVHT